MVSGIVALDIDVRPNKDGEVSLLNAGVELTNSWQVERRGRQAYFLSLSEKPVQNRAGNLLGEGVDFRGDGGDVIFAGALLLTDSTNPSPDLIRGPRILRNFQTSFWLIASKFQISN